MNISDSARISVSSIPATASEMVMPSRSPISSDTGTRNEWLVPKSPTKASTQALRSGVRRTAQMTRAQPARGMAGGKYVREDADTFSSSVLIKTLGAK